jgi:hypothetical protein
MTNPLTRLSNRAVTYALLSVLAAFLLFTPAHAATKSCGGVVTSVVKCDSSGGGIITDLLLVVINFLAVGVGIAVVGGIIWGGLIYASSNGDSAKTKQAVNIIVNAVIGLLLFFFMYAIINFLVPGGIFT